MLELLAFFAVAWFYPVPLLLALALLAVLVAAGWLAGVITDRFTKGGRP